MELYDYPQISVKLLASEVDLKANPRPKATWDLRLKEWKWFTQFNDNGVLICVVAKDQNEKVRFSWGKYDKKLHESRQQSK